jgi:hypothetical protein
MGSTVSGLLLVVLSFLVLGAHFLRSGDVLLVAACILFAMLLLVPRRWAARAVQVALVIGTVEWLRTLFLIVQERMALGAPYMRTAIILGVVAAVTLASTLVFRMRALRRRYGLD